MVSSPQIRTTVGYMASHITYPANRIYKFYTFPAKCCGIVSFITTLRNKKYNGFTDRIVKPTYLSTPFIRTSWLLVAWKSTKCTSRSIRLLRTSHCYMSKLSASVAPWPFVAFGIQICQLVFR